MRRKVNLADRCYRKVKNILYMILWNPEKEGRPFYFSILSEYLFYLTTFST